MQMKLRRLMALMIGTGLFVAGVVTPAVAVPDAVVNASFRGWWVSNGRSGSNNNYCIGRECSGGRAERNFFVFNLPSSSEAITEATLYAQNPSAFGTTRPFTLHAISSSVAELTADMPNPSPAGVAVFKDLGDGTVLGSRTPASLGESPVYVGLNARGRIAATKRLGTTFSVGGMLEGDTDEDSLFGGSSGVPASGVQLVYYLGPGTSLSLNVPGKVNEGARVNIRGHLDSSYAPCSDQQELDLKVGSQNNDVTTDASGDFSIRRKITKKTTVSALSAGGFAASDQGCGASEAKATIKV